MDASPEYKGYASDVTRTYTKSRIWTKEMRLVYRIVQETQSAAIEAFASGSRWAHVDRAALEKLTERLIEHGFLFGNKTEMIQERAAYAFMLRGLGHPVGLDVHNPLPTRYARDRNRAS